MGAGSARALGRVHATISVPCGEDGHQTMVDNPKQFWERLDAWFAEMPELSPEGFGGGYAMKSVVPDALSDGADGRHGRPAVSPQARRARDPC